MEKQQEKEQPKSEIYPLNTRESVAKIWLVKVPKTVSQEWEKNPDKPLGQISVMNNTVKVLLKDQVYDLQPQKSIPLYAIAKTPKEFKMQGTIENIYSMRPTITKVFEQQVKKRVEDEKETKESKFFNIEDVKQRLAIPIRRKATENEKQTNFRVRGSVEEVEELVHRLFSQDGKSRWTLAELVKETNQPEGFLKKEILSRLCDYHRSGPFKGTYEMKSDFRIQEGEKDEFETIE